MSLLYTPGVGWIPPNSPTKPTAPGITNGQYVQNTRPAPGGPVGWVWSQDLYQWLVTSLIPSTPVAPPAHPVAVQGPVDPTNLYAIITWDRNEPSPVSGYRVYRDGNLLTTITDGGGPDDWNKRYYKDTGVTAHTTHVYQVSSMVGVVESDKSRPYSLHIRASDAGHTIDVSAQIGADTRAKLTAARTAAIATNPTYSTPAVLFFPAGTYDLTLADATNTIASGDKNIIIRGAGKTTTILRCAFAGSSSESGTDKNAIRFTASTTAISGLNPAQPVARGDLTVTLDTAAHGIVVGDKMYINEIASTFATALDATESYDAWDVNYVEAVNGAVITVRFPWAKPFTTAAIVGTLTISGCGIEQCTIEGQSNTEQGYYTLLSVEHCAQHSIAECRFRYFNRNAIYIRGYYNRVVACDFTLTDPRAYAGESQRYMLSSGRGRGLRVIANNFGDSDRDSSSMVTNSVSHAQVVRHNQFIRSVNYGWNSHGAGDYWDVIENNYFFMPNSAKSGVFLGNSSFVYAGPARVRGNLFDQCKTACIAMQQNTYQFMITDNWFRDAIDDLINWYGASLPNMAAATYGSARGVIRRNQCDYTSGAKANRGYIIGQALSPNPFAGIRDIIIDHNEIDCDGFPMVLGGTAAESYGLQVYGNSGLSTYEHPPLVPGDYWADNADSVATTGPGSDGTPYFSDTFSGTAGADAGWPIYLKTATGSGITFPVSSSGNYGRLSVTSATFGARKNLCALRSEIITDSMQLTDIRNASLTLSRLQCLTARHQSGVSNVADRYRCVYEVGTGVTNRFRIEKVIGGVATVLAQTTAIDASLTADLRMRFEVVGTTLRANAWLVTGAEGGGWMLSITDTSIQNDGRCGVSLDAPDATTISADFDNYKLVNWSKNAQPNFGTATDQTWDQEVWSWELLDGIAEVGP